MTLRELLQDLEARGRVREGSIERAARLLRADDDRTPWYLSLLTAAGAWVATLFFLLGAGLLIDFGGGWTDWAIVAVVFLGLGLGLRRWSGHLFVTQLSLGLTLAGWVAGLVAGTQLLDADFGGAVLCGAVLGVAVYLLHPDAALRFLVSASELGLLTVWCFVEFDGSAALMRNLPVVLAAGGTALLARPGLGERLAPLAHASALGLAVVSPLIDALPLSVLSTRIWWPSALVLTALLAVFVWRLLRDAPAPIRREALPLALGAVLAIGLACFGGGPGLLAAVGLLLLGHAGARRPVEWLGLISLPVFLFLYYRDLDVPLLAKSATVVGSGLALLALRRLLAGRAWAKEAA